MVPNWPERFSKGGGWSFMAGSQASRPMYRRPLYPPQAVCIDQFAISRKVMAPVELRTRHFACGLPGRELAALGAEGQFTQLPAEQSVIVTELKGLRRERPGQDPAERGGGIQDVPHASSSSSSRSNSW